MAIIRRNDHDLMDVPTTFTSMLDRVFDDFTRSTGLRQFTPTVDIVENDSEYEIDVHAPGMKKEDFDLQVDDNRLRISGEKSYEEKDEKKNYYLRESGYGRFERSFPLPDNTDADQIKAEYNDGVLKLHLPKTEKKENQKRIEIS